MTPDQVQRWQALLDVPDVDAAFELLVHVTQRELWHIGIGMLNDRDNAQEIVQECYLTALDALRRGQWDGQKPDAWLRVVLTRLALGRLRRARRWRRIMSLIPSGRSTPQEIDNHMPSYINIHLDELPLMQRAALVLQVIDGASVSEIALALERSEGAVEQLLVRARRTLRQRLREAPGADS